MTIAIIDRGTPGDTGDKFKPGVAFDTCQANDNYLDAKIDSEIAALTVATFAALASTPAELGQLVNTTCHTSGVKGALTYKAVSSVGLTANGGTISVSATAGVYWQAVNYTFLDVAMFGCVGAGDESAKLQLAIDAAILSGVTLTGTGSYTSNTALTASSKISIYKEGDCIAQSFKISTSSTNDILKIQGDASSIIGLTLEHTGSAGRLLSIEDCQAVSVENLRLIAVHAACADPIIYFHGSNTYIKKCRTDNLRPNAWSIDCDRTTGLLNINSNVDDNYFGGTGKGMIVHSSDDSARPEGVSWTNNDLVITNTHVEIQCILGFYASGNMMDQANPYNYYLNPSATLGGIEIVNITDRYISTSSNTVTGVCIYYNPSAPGPLKSVNIHDTVFDNASKGVVIFGGDTALVTIDNCDIKNMTTENVSLSGIAEMLTFTNNRMPSAGMTTTIQDGAAGGFINLDKNYFVSSSILALTKTVGANWYIGKNFGLKTYAQLSGNFGALTAGTASVTQTFPHGLYTTPATNFVYATPRINSGTFTAVNILVESTDATNITLRLYYTCTVDGVIAVNIEAYGRT